jgi:P-type Cu2+ transporter
VTALVSNAPTGTSAGLSLEGHWASESEGEGRAVLGIDGMRCANCARKVQRALEVLPGVQRVDVNLVNSRASIDWRSTEIALPRVLEAIASAGFTPVPLVGERAAAARRAEQRLALKRIGLAGLATMQLMMYAAALYIGVFAGSDAQYGEIFRWTCLIIATPVLWYSGAPILRGAVRDLRAGMLGMDVTVGLALVLAFAASAFNTIRGVGEVYFDSVTMFIFLLLLGRYVELRARHQSADVTEALARVLPARVQRLDQDGNTQSVLLSDVREGDRIAVGTGQMVPVDGTLIGIAALLDEALITGESVPRERRGGEALPGGAINLGAGIVLRVSRRPGDSTLQSIVRLIERAQSERPRLGLAAERMASWFVVRILILTALVGAGWMLFDPARAFPAMLAVLVATCPCALSLATPVVAATATALLARRGVLVVRADAVEALGQVDTVLLDKTGTLTRGTARLQDVQVLRQGFARDQAIAIAAALEAQSVHPLAAALRGAAAVNAANTSATAVQEVAGAGVEGTIDGVRWRLGRPAFVAALAAAVAANTAASVAAGRQAADDEPRIVLGDARGIVAAFSVADELRADAASAVRALRDVGLEPRIASGDRAAAVAVVAQQLSVADAQGGLRPDQKLARVKALQAEGRRVLMIGDGINDGPVLAAADVSVAMGQGSGIAQAAADLLLLRDSLAALPDAVRLARRARAIMRQNLAWAIAYNLAVLPLAALGFMPPWLAALGMSLSSLFVVLNGRRVASTHGLAAQASAPRSALSRSSSR